MSACRPAATLDRFAPTLEQIRNDMNAGAKAGAPGCVLVVVTAIAGAIASSTPSSGIPAGRPTGNQRMSID